ncbi:MAG: phosphate regulon transcriptional regulator PhoB [Pseudomonadota bacterium]
MRPTILIVEDEAPLLELLRYNLEAVGYQIKTVSNGDEAELLLSERSFDLIVLDWMLPQIPGIELCRQVRQRGQNRQTPIIMLTARGEEAERVRGLTTGADDYVVKPFSIPELMARIHALLRRSNPDLMSAALVVGDIELDRQTHRVRRQQREIRLGPTEFRLLEFLMRAPGRVYSREQLLNGVWGHDVYVDDRTVDVHIGRLRKAINRGYMRDPIRTVRGAGYGLDDNFAQTASRQSA